MRSVGNVAVAIYAACCFTLCLAFVAGGEPDSGDTVGETIRTAGFIGIGISSVLLAGALLRAAGVTSEKGRLGSGLTWTVRGLVPFAIVPIAVAFGAALTTLR